MFKKIEDLNYYELLEVSPTATSQEIHRAYERVRRVYDPNSIALYSLFSAEDMTSINKRIENAYRTLMYESHRRKYDAQLRGREQALEQPLPPLPGDPGYKPSSQNAPRADAQQPEEALSRESLPPPPPFNAEFTGPALKLLREQRKMTIREVSDTTKIGARYLELIEEESFQKLPARPYLRGFLTLYAKALGYEPERVVNDYLKRYEAEMNPQKK